jgi:hypothetical protein
MELDAQASPVNDLGSLVLPGGRKATASKHSLKLAAERPLTPSLPSSVCDSAGSFRPFKFD